ncbi:hypothetical protein MPH_10112 [Macrophomina phaseolina MS6]|uniref:Uncharacterized protein n=1 Tax=Macrophomina phaseolina (strain MS6) TaxID=1126212 RepID=K2S7A7_MACPH|nr:hypothetical protein MPH_10112 [Macrophomina phaseolina MS6]
MPSTELQKQASGLRKSHAKSAAPAVAASRPSAYEIMAARIANRVAEMAESMTFVERPVSELAKDENVSEEIKKEQFAQSAELSRVIALICAEKARQGG